MAPLPVLSALHTKQFSCYDGIFKDKLERNRYIVISCLCHHGKVRPQGADGGTAFSMDGSCSRGQPTRGDVPAWGLGEVLTTPHR